MQKQKYFSWGGCVFACFAAACYLLFSWVVFALDDVGEEAEIVSYEILDGDIFANEVVIVNDNKRVSLRKLADEYQEMKKEELDAKKIKKVIQRRKNIEQFADDELKILREAEVAYDNCSAKIDGLRAEVVSGEEKDREWRLSFNDTLVGCVWKMKEFSKRSSVLEGRNWNVFGKKLIINDASDAWDVFVEDYSEVVSGFDGAVDDELTDVVSEDLLLYGAVSVFVVLIALTLFVVFVLRGDDGEDKDM